MGFLKVRATIRNPAERGRAAQAELLVDSGATLTVVPRSVLEKIGLTAEAVRRLRTADGRPLERARSTACVEIEGQADTVPVLFGEEGDVPVLGVTTLEILRLAFDPVRGELRPSEYLYLFELRI